MNWLTLTETQIPKPVKEVPEAKGKASNDDSGELINDGIVFKMDTQWFDGEEVKIKVGYMAMNILKPMEGAQWGVFNNRLVKQKWVDDLAALYENNKWNCRTLSAMFIAVKRSWIKNADEAWSGEKLAGKHISEVPMLELTDEAKKIIAHSDEAELYFLSGNHRRLALHKQMEKLIKAKEAAEKDAEKAHAKQREGGANLQLDAQEKSSREKAAKLEREIEMGSRWAVLVYDRGE
jgi:cytochrome c1